MTEQDKMLQKIAEQIQYHKDMIELLGDVEFFVKNVGDEPETAEIIAKYNNLLNIKTTL